MCLTPEAEVECQAGADDQLEYSASNVIPLHRETFPPADDYPFAPGAIEHHKARPSIWWQRLGAAILIASAVLMLWAAWHWRDVPARAGEAVAELFGRMR